MKHFPHLYIDGRRVEPATPDHVDLVDPTREEVFARVAIGGAEDADRAVAAARRAFAAFSTTTVADRVAMIDRLIDAYEARESEFADLIAREVGIPVANTAQVTGPVAHMRVARDLLRDYPFETRMGNAVVRREPIGVCALISPWNWPIQTGVIKLVYALAAGCTVVAKPSINSAASGALFAEVVHEAGLPAGVVNIVNGRGRDVGDVLTRHPEVDMISFTGSTAAGRTVGAAAAERIARVCLELGGKSAAVVLPGADLEQAARWTVQRAFFNAGQSCHAPTRLLVHESEVDRIAPVLVAEAESFVLGDPLAAGTTMGPLVSRAQYDSVRDYIRVGIAEGAELLVGGAERPAGIDTGYFVKPTVFTGVTPDMTIAREEIFGPVLAVMSYADEEEAVRIANDTPYGLGGYVFGPDVAAREVAGRIRAGRISVNGAATDSFAPMGGYKESGIGRSMGRYGFEEYLELKSIYGFEGDAAALPVAASIDEVRR